MIEYLDVHAASARDNIHWPDVYFAPSYGAAMEESDGGTWEVAVGAGGRILSPYLLRPIDPELCGGDRLFDAVSPYGYAGTWVAPGVSPREVAAFRVELRRSQAERGVVTEFQRLGGLVPGRSEVIDADPDAEAIRHNDTVELVMDGDYDTYWTGAHGRHRTSVRKARKTGYIWAENSAPLDELLDGGRFRALYDDTMRRVDAKPYYFFTDRYYELLHAALGDDLRLGRVLNGEGTMVAAALFMRWGDRLHYHLAGSERDAARAGANNLLLDGTIAWGFDYGIRSLHLGGGLRADDALFKFKIQFGGQRVPFWLLRTVLDPSRYTQLVTRRAAQTDRSPEELVMSGFFPAYRA